MKQLLISNRKIEFLKLLISKVQCMIIFRNIFIMCSLLLTSCSAPLYETRTKIDLLKLNDSNSRYGVTLFRAIYFDNNSSDTICNIRLPNLEYDYPLSISVHPSYNKGGYFEYITGNPDSDIVSQFKTKAPSYLEGFADFISFNQKPIMTMPEYYYGVRMLPEGRYYFKTIYGSPGHRDYKETEEVNYFDVKAGEVTYIGDYYWMNNVKFDRNFKDHLMSQTRGSVEIKLCDRFDEAKQFFQKYYSHVKLPIKKNLLKCCEAYKTN